MHHWSYEPEHRLDVIPLCTTCHAAVHRGNIPEPRTGRRYVLRTPTPLPPRQYPPVDPVALAVWRERKHKTRDELAAAVKVTERAVRAWEYGARRMGADDVHRCAVALGLVDTEELALHRWAASICPPPEGKRPAAGEGA